MTVIPTIDLVDALAAEYADKSPREILELALAKKVKLQFHFQVQKMLF
jgi:phosphoadenosine phosphosulfate reductase